MNGSIRVFNRNRCEFVSEQVKKTQDVACFNDQRRCVYVWMNQYALLIEQVPVDCNVDAVRCVVKKSRDRHGTLGESEYVFELFRCCEPQPCNAELFAD